MNVDITSKHITPMVLYANHFNVLDDRMLERISVIPSDGGVYPCYYDSRMDRYFVLDLEDREYTTFSSPDQWDISFGSTAFKQFHEDDSISYKFTPLSKNNVVHLDLTTDDIEKAITFLSQKREPTTPADTITKEEFQEQILSLKGESPELLEKLYAAAESFNYTKENYPELQQSLHDLETAMDYFMYNSDLSEIPIHQLQINNKKPSDFYINKIKEMVNKYSTEPTNREKRKALYRIGAYCLIELSRL